MRPALNASLALCLLGAAAAAVAAPEADRRAVTVQGEGEVYAAPDRARLSMAVEDTETDLKAAQAKVNGIVKAYLAQARALGIKDEDVSTAGLSIDAQYDYSGNKGRKFLGYHVVRSLELVVRDLDKIGDYLGKATEAGINNVSNPQLESSKADELQRQALAKAALDAQAKAKMLAETLGVKLGPVHDLNAATEVVRPPVPQVRMLAMAAAAPESGNDQMGFSAGQIRVHTSVTAQFDLLAP